MQLIKEFHDAVYDYVARNKFPVPIGTNQFVVDTRFSTMPYTADVFQSDADVNVPSTVYNEIFKVLDTQVDNDTMYYVCNSETIDEDPERGEYRYYVSTLNNLLCVYGQPTHPDIYNNRCVIFGSRYQMHVSSGELIVYVYHTDPDVYDLRLIQNKKELADHIRDYLKNTDRPKISDEYQPSIFDIRGGRYE